MTPTMHRQITAILKRLPAKLTHIATGLVRIIRVVIHATHAQNQAAILANHARLRHAPRFSLILILIIHRVVLIVVALLDGVPGGRRFLPTLGPAVGREIPRRQTGVRATREASIEAGHRGERARVEPTAEVGVDAAGLLHRALFAAASVTFSGESGQALLVGRYVVRGLGGFLADAKRARRIRVVIVLVVVAWLHQRVLIAGFHFDIRIILKYKTNKQKIKN